MEGQLAVHLPGTDPEEPAELADREILNMNKKNIFSANRKFTAAILNDFCLPLVVIAPSFLVVIPSLHFFE